MAKIPWKPWHEVVSLRDDLRSGELPMHMFAADLYEVLMQRGKRPIYEHPEQFFALTFPTYNLRQLVRDVMLRVAGKNDKAVRQLELTYGGGKTHTLITLRQLVHDPANLPDLPAVAEFREAIGQEPPKARVAGLCFDKLDVEKGMEVRSPEGKSRTLKHPWSVLAYQIAGDAGLRLLHAKDKAEERDSAPAENLLTELLELPQKDKLGILILIDEVLVYVREKVAADREWRDRMINFFQYLTQAATKVDRCCIVASLLASDPHQSDSHGRELQGQLYDIFQRQREEAIEPVVKEDVAELLRRRFFTPKSLEAARPSFPQHVQAALKGITAIDEQTEKQGAQAEERYLKSYPFHPDLTEVFYTKWTNLDRFQRARGVLRTFALALREAEKWDNGPLVGSNVFLTAPGQPGLSEALRELVIVAETEEHEGRKQAWTGVMDGEIGRAREIQQDSVGLRSREIEQAVVTTFLHSQPIGQTARTRDLVVLLGATRPDRIELEKGLMRWAQASYWLDDQYTGVGESQLPGTWRLGNRPNLNQMHAVARGRISDEIVRARLVDEIGRVKSLSSGAAAAGVKVHMLPARIRDVEDDGHFRYAILSAGAASDSGKPSAEAKRYLDETTGPDKPRVYRNAVLLLTASKDGLEVATARIRDHLAWEQVLVDLKEQEKEGRLDPARMSTLAFNLDKSKGRIPEAIRQAYCIVVTVSEKNEVQAFKINVTDEPHFTIIKGDARSRVQDSPISAEALLPDGPYNLWREGETSRRVRDLTGAFAQMPHLPKMLKAQAIQETLVAGCDRGAFVLRLTRPDGSFRTWWCSRPDESAMSDPAMELVLPEAGELAEIGDGLLAEGRLPELWVGEELETVALLDYFSGSKTVQMQRAGYTEPLFIPKASKEVVFAAVHRAVEEGTLWLINPPASLLAEPIPAGLLTQRAVVRVPPGLVAAAEILPENLPDAWSDERATALSVATALSALRGISLPWKTVKDAISSALSARFLELDPASGAWPCEFQSARTIVLKMSEIGANRETASGVGLLPRRGESNVLVADEELESSEVQELGDVIPEILDLKNKENLQIRFRVEIILGDGTVKPSDHIRNQMNNLLQRVKEGLELW